MSKGIVFIVLIVGRFLIHIYVCPWLINNALECLGNDDGRAFLWATGKKMWKIIVYPVQIIRSKLLKIWISKHLSGIKEVPHLPTCPIGGQGATLSLFPHWVKYKQNISCTLSWGLGWAPPNVSWSNKVWCGNKLTFTFFFNNMALLFLYLAHNTGEHIILPCEHWYLVLDSLPFREETWETLLILLWYNEQWILLTQAFVVAPPVFLLEM